MVGVGLVLVAIAVCAVGDFGVIDGCRNFGSGLGLSWLDVAIVLVLCYCVSCDFRFVRLA